jgi:hypothetical protein
MPPITRSTSMITIDSEARLREVILGLDVPADIKRSIYYDCKRGYSFEWGNEEQCDTPGWGRKRGQRKPPFTLVLPDGEGLTITGPLYEEMVHAVGDRRRREAVRAASVQSLRTHQEAQRGRYAVVGTVRGGGAPRAALPTNAPGLTGYQARVSAGDATHRAAQATRGER